MWAVADGLADNGRLDVRRHGHVEHLDRLVGEQVGDGGVAARDVRACSAAARARAGSREAMATGLKPAWR